MKYCILILFSALLMTSINTKAQVQVSKEPHHINVFENKYLRILDVNLQPHDTTFFHIHSTPSVFMQFSTTVTGIQVKGKDWVRVQNVSGSASYRSFVNDTVVHRVSNWDTVSFHVNDIELLSAYNSNNRLIPLPFTVLLDNERVIKISSATAVL